MWTVLLLSIVANDSKEFKQAKTVDNRVNRRSNLVVLVKNK